MPTRQRNPLKYTPPTTPKPIQVFISSDSKEFGELRERLQKCIDAEYMYNDERTYEEDEKAEFVHQGNIMKSVVVEAKSEETFEERMKEGLESSQIYVGIFGNLYSVPTCREYEYARQLGLPLLVYYFTQPARVARGAHTKVVRFLNRNLKDQNPSLVIRGNYGKIVARQYAELIDLILSDLACTVADNVRETVGVRQMLIKMAPNSTVGVVLRARKPVFA